MTTYSRSSTQCADDEGAPSHDHPLRPDRRKSWSRYRGTRELLAGIDLASAPAIRQPGQLAFGSLADLSRSGAAHDKLLPHIRQQLRWVRSTYRDAARFAPAALVDRYLTLDVLGQPFRPLLLAISSIAALAQLALTDSLPGWTGLTVAATTMIRCSVAALRASELQFSDSRCTPRSTSSPDESLRALYLSNSDWLSRRLPHLLDENEIHAIFCTRPRTDTLKGIVCTRIQPLKHRIAFQLKVLVQPICQGRFARGAIGLLDELTSELVAATLAVVATAEASASRRTVPAENTVTSFIQKTSAS